MNNSSRNQGQYNYSVVIKTRTLMVVLVDTTLVIKRDSINGCLNDDTNSNRHNQDRVATRA